MRASIRLVMALGGVCALASSASGADPHALQDFAIPFDVGSYAAGGGMTLDNQGVGGVGGPGDGYLRLAVAFEGNFGAFTNAPEFTGDYPASGVGGVSFWLKDVGAAQPIQIHLSLGQGQSNFYQYDAPFHPGPEWTKFYVNLADINPAQWTQTHGGGALDDALRHVAKLHFRHDLPPYVFFPEGIEADMGLDRVRLHPPCPGETNGDDRVDFADLNNCLTNFGRSGVNLPGDVNNSGAVDFADLNILLTSFNTTC